MARKMRVRPRATEPEVPEVDENELVDHALGFAHAKAKEREGEEERKRISGVLLPILRNSGRKSVKVSYDEDTDATVMRKTRENLKINEDRLKKAIGARAYKKLTMEVLDEAKVEAAIQLGDLDANVVASCTEGGTTDYLECRFTKKRVRG